jgi:hypothetical protein
MNFNPKGKNDESSNHHEVERHVEYDAVRQQRVRVSEKQKLRKKRQRKPTHPQNDEQFKTTKHTRARAVWTHLG